MRRVFIALIVMVLYTLIATNVSSAGDAVVNYGKYVHGVNTGLRTIYQAGLAEGNEPAVFAKIGDSITWARAKFFLYPVGDGRIDYGNYTRLRRAVEYYGAEELVDGENSFTTISTGAVSALTSEDLQDPADAPAGCGGLSRVECEFERINPSVAVIMVGTTDIHAFGDAARFETSLRDLVELCLDRSIIPILTTIPETNSRWVIGVDVWLDVDSYNAVIENTARRYAVPYIDYHAAMDSLDGYGLDEFMIHPSAPVDENTADFADGDLSTYGYTVRNIVTLEALNQVYARLNPRARARTVR